VLVENVIVTLGFQGMIVHLVRYFKLLKTIFFNNLIWIDICPVLCNNHGKYENGKCICDYNWKGSDCSITLDQCEVSDCNGFGDCIAGRW
jgi:hypothetical protein